MVVAADGPPEVGMVELEENIVELVYVGSDPQLDRLDEAAALPAPPKPPRAAPAGARALPVPPP